MKTMSETPAASAHSNAPSGYTERLLPGPGLFIVLLLIIPAVLLTVTPLNGAWALPIAVATYVIIAGSLALMAPTVRVDRGTLMAGPASIPVSLLGTGEALNREELRAAIGPGTDARTFLLLRGYIHSGVRIPVTDPADPTPQWILTSRKPDALLAAIDEAKRTS